MTQLPPKSVPTRDLVFPNLDVGVPLNGYRWWYLDALSNDGELGLTVIVFIGSVFSPYYASRRRRAPTNPDNHCAINVALYGNRGRRWAMTERSAASLGREVDWLRIGNSHMEASDGVITFHINEWASPLPRQILGTIRIRQNAQTEAAFALGADDTHFWWPISPRVEVDVDLTLPDLAWQGTGYFDTNWGTEPLEAGFTEWCWGRAARGEDTVIHYDVLRKNGEARSLLLSVDPKGQVVQHPSVASADLPSTRIWRVNRQTRSESSAARLVQTLEDTPFYARSLIETQLFGEPVVAFHESLSLERFRQRWVQTLLPFRMPRMP